MSFGAARVRHGVACAALMMFATSLNAAASLSKLDSLKLAQMQVDGAGAVSVAVIAARGRQASVARSVTELGGRVRFRHDAVGLISAILPLGQVAQFARAPGVEALGVDGGEVSIVMLDAQPPPELRSKEGRGELDEARVAVDHESLLEDLGAEDFRHAHPSFDGRGVVIAHVENAPDFLSPELQTGLDAHGRTVRKFRAVMNFPDLEPRLDGHAQPIGSNAWQWVKLSPPLRARGGTLRVGGQDYRVPQAGHWYRTGTLRMPDELREKLRFQGAVGAAAPERGVLWSDDERRSWIDTNADHDFTNDPPVGEFAATGEFGVLGTDDPATEIRESVAYALEKQGDFLSLMVGQSSHATGVAGFAGASRGSHGRVEGVAPGVQFITISHGSTVSTFARALVAAFESAADIVLLEDQDPTTGSRDLQDESSVLDLLIARLIALHGKACFITANNDAGLSTVWDPSPANAISVGASQSRRATQLHFGFTMEREFDLHWATSEGPTGRGSLKPDLLAPVVHLAPDSGLEPGGELAGLFRLTVGYQVFGGTSGATPVAAGAAALLVSGARQRGIHIGAGALEEALRNSAQFEPQIQAHQQGVGRLQVGHAWNLLSRHAAGTGSVRIEIAAPVDTRTSGLLSPPNVGGGLFLKEGMRSGVREERKIRLTRLDGPTAPLHLQTRWIGNDDGVFSAPAVVDLPRHAPIDMPVVITPASPGVHSAILELRELEARTPAQRVPVTIVVPYELEQSTAFEAHGQLTLNRPGRADLFFRVREGMDALTLSFYVPGEASIGPDPEMIAATVRSPENHGEAMLLVDPATRRASVSLERPIPGVWELAIADFSHKFVYDPRGFARSRTDRLEFSASAARVQIAMDEAGASGAKTLHVTNAAAALSGGVLNQALGRTIRFDGNIGRDERAIFPFDVAPGVELLVLDFTAVRPANEDIDVLLFHCSDGRCTLYRASRSRAPNGRMVIQNAAPGAWKLVISGDFLQQPSAAYECAVVMTSPRLGALVTNDIVAPRASGETWDVMSGFWLPRPTRADKDLVALTFLTAPALRSLHEPEASMRPFIAIPWHAEPLLLGLQQIANGIHADAGNRGP